MKKERYIVLCILVVLFILAIIVLFEKYVISANLQEGATNNFSSYFVPFDTADKEINSATNNMVVASTVFITKNPSEKPNVNLFADYTYYLVINPADVPDMESTLNYLTLTDLPKIQSSSSIKNGYDAKNKNIWETTTQEFAIPFVLNGSSDSSWLTGTHESNTYRNIPNAYGLQLKFGTMSYNQIGASFSDGVSFDRIKQYKSGNQIPLGSQILLKSKEDIIQNPFLYEWFSTQNYIDYTRGEVKDEGASPTMYYTNVAEDDIPKENLSSTDSGSTGLFVGYIDNLSYISKTDIQNADVSNDVKPTILNKKIPVYLVKGDFNPYKPKPVSYFDTSSYCDGDKIYIGAKNYTTISTTQEDEESCAKKCEDNENCDMYLMQNENTCWTYKDVSDISMFCNQGNDPVPHMYWGKFKSSIDMRDIVRYPESTAEQKAQQEQALAQQEAKEAKQEQALAETESQDARGEESKYTSEEAKYTSEEAKYTSEKAKFTSEEAKLTSEEERADYLKAKLLSYSNTISNLKDQLANCSKKTPTLGAMEFKPAPAPACIPDPNKPKPFNIHVHYSNYNTNV